MNNTLPRYAIQTAHKAINKFLTALLIVKLNFFIPIKVITYINNAIDAKITLIIKFVVNTD